MSVKERKKGKSVWSLLFGFSEEFDETKNVLSDETYDKELKKALANIEKMEKRFEVKDQKVEKQSKMQYSYKGKNKTTNQPIKETIEQEAEKERE